MTRVSTRVIYTLVLTLGLGCSSGGGGDDGDDPQDDDAFLTIVGDTNLFVDLGQTQQLRVKYHDRDGNPLAGNVSFRLMGNTAGSLLSSSMDGTDSSGHADVVLTGGQQATFRVVAEADSAASVEWRVTVGQGAGVLDLAGSYSLDSQFDMATGLPGDAGNVVNAFIEMTDDPNDPASWLLDQLAESLDSGILESALDLARPGLDALVNEEIISRSPNLITMLRDVGNDLGQVARKFGLRSRYTVTAAAGAFTAVHEVTGIHWNVDGVTHEYTAAEVELGMVRAENIATMLVQNKVSIAEHSLPLSYGRILVFVLNHVLIPSATPFAGSLEDLLLANVDCDAIGWDVYYEVNVGSQSLYESACLSALDAASDALEDALRGVDGAGSALVIKGDATPADMTGDGKVDRMMNGLWEGSFRIGGESATLARPDQKFLGERVTTP
jgi:hypothetical protein